MSASLALEKCPVKNSDPPPRKGSMYVDESFSTGT
jgi:hypothetical protein